MGKVSISSKEIGAKFEAKNEIYRFLASEVGVYLPSYETITIFHLRDIMSGAKKKVKSAQIRHISIPSFEGLYLKDILEFAK